MDITPFRIAISDSALADLQQRLAHVRWPETLPGSGWREGAEIGFMRRLADHWQHRFDWRAQEARLNQLPQFLTRIDGLDVHFVHQRGTGPAPLPLVLTHGWPGSFVEMEEIIPLLADPGSHGGDPADAFDVVVPSLPGYGFSQAPVQEGVGPRAVADMWAVLMKRLGYARYGLQGGDIGAGVSTWLARHYPEQVAGLHLNFIPGSYRPPTGAGEAAPSEEEQAFLQRCGAWLDAEGGYSHIQRTKPQTVAYGLNDSPLGLAAWIAEKFQAWSDCGGDVESTLGFDTMLTDIAIYWFTGCIGSSFRMYLEGSKQPLQFASGDRVLPPLGVAVFPREILMPPRAWVERVFDVQRWTTMPHGGHFAALETPQLLVQEIREFFRPLR
jgi:pimeloyl-ACP methyl ester carboxylesterase